MDKFNSRKYRLAKIIIWIATCMAVIPPMVTVWLLPVPLILITGTEWASIVSATLLFYTSSNVLQKKFVQAEEPQDEK